MGARGWALVTGAGRRIGRALALAAARAGHDLVIHHHLSQADAAETRRLVEAEGAGAVVLAADLADAGACAALIAAAPRPLTLLVNSASVFEEDRLQTLTAEGLDRALAINLRAPVLLARDLAAALEAERGGQVVNILDQRVLRPTPLFFSYAASKAALWAVTGAMAQALAPTVRVNAIAPGPTLASVHQSADAFAAEAAAVLLGRGPSADEIGAALAYLIDAASVTGQTLTVDGGQHLAWRTPDIVDG